MRQRQLQSDQVNLEQTDYSHFSPKAKKTVIEEKVTDVPTAKGRKVNDDFKAVVAVQEPHMENYDAKQRALAVL